MLGATRTLGRWKGPWGPALPTEVTGRQEPLPTMMEDGQEGWGGRMEERRLGSGVVWYEAPESAIQWVRTGGITGRAQAGGRDIGGAA